MVNVEGLFGRIQLVSFWGNSQGEKQQNLAEPLNKISSGGFYIFSILGTSSHHFWMITSKIGGRKSFIHIYSHLYTTLFAPPNFERDYLEKK